MRKYGLQSIFLLFLSDNSFIFLSLMTTQCMTYAIFYYRKSQNTINAIFISID